MIQHHHGSNNLLVNGWKALPNGENTVENNLNHWLMVDSTIVEYSHQPLNKRLVASGHKVVLIGNGASPRQIQP